MGDDEPDRGREYNDGRERHDAVSEEFCWQNKTYQQKNKPDAQTLE